MDIIVEITKMYDMIENSMISHAESCETCIKYEECAISEKNFDMLEKIGDCLDIIA